MTTRQTVRQRLRRARAFLLCLPVDMRALRGLDVSQEVERLRRRLRPAGSKALK